MIPRKPLGEAELLLPFSQPRPGQDLQERAEAEGMSSGAGSLGLSTCLSLDCLRSWPIFTEESVVCILQLCLKIS